MKNIEDESEVWMGDSAPTVVLMEEQCRLHGILDWDNKKTARLCRMLKITPYELCATSGMFDRVKVRRFWRENNWPSELAIQFHRLQQFTDKVLFKTEAGPDIGYSFAALFLNNAQEQHKEPSHD